MNIFLMLVLRFFTRFFLAGFRRCCCFLDLLTPLPLRGGTDTVVGALYMAQLFVGIELS